MGSAVQHEIALQQHRVSAAVVLWTVPLEVSLIMQKLASDSLEAVHIRADAGFSLTPPGGKLRVAAHTFAVKLFTCMLPCRNEQTSDCKRKLRDQLPIGNRPAARQPLRNLKRLEQNLEMSLPRW